ncbi:MAG TPA: bifunctional lysylphosphatidylglycerol flippase/synthetase MprF [Pirellulales bacterium]|nr:bifunctional lysylphosphatidylglycerol flippase/synthetase MprF [Pirellulales bacterium]
MKQDSRHAARGAPAWRQRVLGVAGSLAVVLIFSAAVFVLHRELRDYSLRDIEERLSLLSWKQLGAALAMTALSYTLLTGYDWLALHYIDRSLSYSRIALASFVSYVSSYNFGAILGGSTMRYRLYSTFGLSAVEVVKIIAICTVTFVLGFCTLAGAVFTFDPLPLPEVVEVKLPVTTVFPIGITLLAGVGAYLCFSALRLRPVAVRGWEFSLPPPGFTLMQMFIASADLMAASAVLYALLPAEIAVSYPKFMGMFLTAQVAGIMSHVPGGLGVVEAILLHTLAPQDPAAVMGSLVVYRLTYYLLPLVLATGLLAGHEASLRWKTVTRYAGLFGRWAPEIVPRVLAGTTFASGAALLVYGALPRTVSRWHWLSDFVPLPVVEFSHLFGSVAGMGLLLLARGLLERLDAAYHLSVGLLTCGIVVSLLRGFNLEEASILTVMLLALLPSRRYFDRRASLLHETLTPGWITSIVLVFLGTLWLGVFSHKHVEYTNSLWWRFALAEDAPRSLRAMVGAAAVLVAAGVARLLRPADPQAHTPDEEELAAAERVATESPRTSAYLALLADKSLLFNESRTAFLMYAIEGSSWVVLGDPVGTRAEANELAWQFRELCDRHAGTPVFYQVSAANLPLYLDLGLSLLKLGEEGRVSLADFSLEGGSQRHLREAVRKAQHAGCTFEVIPREAVPPLLPELKEISDQWLATRNAREKGFSLGFFREDYLRRFPLALVRHEERIVGFANVLCGAGKHELSIDLMRYRPAGPAGIMDYLFVELMLWGRAQGFENFSMGMAPLSGLDVGPLAPLWHRLGTLVFRHGEHFYNFQGLRQYKEKFHPQWEPKYLASPGGLRLPKILANVATLISAGATRTKE